jgi:hypothetical protein
MHMFDNFRNEINPSPFYWTDCTKPTEWAESPLAWIVGHSGKTKPYVYTPVHPGN